ncbi:MAG: hypothetical protein VKJ64_01810, partial [Leptolyngbyaceae bacterium]|nr:hypothetical protein [Leptolyngbyaceae bacterium]
MANDPAVTNQSSPNPDSSNRKSFWSVLGEVNQVLQTGATEMIDGTTKAIGEKADQTGKVVGGAIAGTTKAIGETVDQTGKVVGGAIAGTTNALGNAVDHTGKVVSTGQKKAQETLVSSTNALGETVTGVGQAVGSVIQGSSNAVGKAIAGTGNAIGSTVMATAEFTKGRLQVLRKNLDVKLLLPIIEQVDLQAAATVAQEIREKYPDDSNEALAHRLMQKKVFIVAGLGFASSVIPGSAAALMGFDLAALASIQAELGYQIAAVYGLDLEDSARPWEILAIFGAAMGTNFALKTGLEMTLQSIPIAGSIVGAGTNAMALYAVGYAACRFYENEGKALQSDAAAQAAQTAGENYLKAAQPQQILVDQIIAHMVKASFPDRSWPETLPELEPYYLSPASLATIEAHIDNPVSLDELLENLSPDYSLVALYACRAIATADHTITPDEQVILTA